jgi:hypothetical protein
VITSKLRILATVPIASLALLAFAPGCGSDSSGLANGPGDAGGGIIAADDGGSTTEGPPPVGALLGTVVAPEGTIPIAGALVYLTKTEPGPSPSGAYCDKCVQLTSNAFTYSEPNGTFRLPAYETGTQFLVTQKGQFRRVRRVDVQAGDQPANASDTRLPGRNDAANGDTIPKMKVMQANWDAISNSLRKLGITEYDGPPGGFTIDRTLDDAALLSKYHIVFIPCSGSTSSDIGDGPACSGIYTPSSSGKRVMKDFIQAGGKLYVTDWSYEYVNQTWPGFIRFKGESNNVIGSACTIGTYSGDAVWGDTSLEAWMNAIGERNAQLEKSYVGIDGTAPQQGLDEDGRSVLITPKVWASTMANGSPRIATVSFQDKCGRVMYSTYHAEGTDNGGSNTLLAQEKALFHILLEVSACVGIRPEPPR